MLYMVVEHFKKNDAVPIYRRFKAKGRLAPEGLRYVSSWVDSNMQTCFQLMETHDRKLIDAWISNWADMIDFEVFQVMSSEEAVEKIAPALSK